MLTSLPTGVTAFLVLQSIESGRFLRLSVTSGAREGEEVSENELLFLPLAVSSLS